MQYNEEQIAYDKSRKITLTITDIDMMTLFPLLTDFDKALIKECEASIKVADKLLMLEMIVRKLTEHSDKIKKLKTFDKVTK